jgi:hypothetical protein
MSKYCWQQNLERNSHILYRDDVRVAEVERSPMPGAGWHNEVVTPDGGDYTSATAMTFADARKDALALAKHVWDNVPLPEGVEL